MNLIGCLAQLLAMLSRRWCWWPTQKGLGGHLQKGLLVIGPFWVSSVIEGCPISKKKWSLDHAAGVHSLGGGEAELRLGVYKYRPPVGCISSPRPLSLILVAICNVGFWGKLLAVPYLHLPHIVIRLPWGDWISVNASKLVYRGQLFILMFFLSFLCLPLISSCLYMFFLFFVSFSPSLFPCLLPLNMSFFSLPLTIPVSSV